jgi:hypothetical protein
VVFLIFVVPATIAALALGVVSVRGGDWQRPRWLGLAGILLLVAVGSSVFDAARSPDGVSGMDVANGTLIAVGIGTLVVLGYAAVGLLVGSASTSARGRTAIGVTAAVWLVLAIPLAYVVLIAVLITGDTLGCSGGEGYGCTAGFD